MKRYAFLLLFFFASTAVFAGPETSAPLIGQVVDKNSNEALAGVEVFIRETGKSVYTDFEGHFLITDVPAEGRCTLEIRYLTYQQAETILLPNKDDVKIRLEQLP